MEKATHNGKVTRAGFASGFCEVYGRYVLRHDGLSYVVTTPGVVERARGLRSARAIAVFLAGSSVCGIANTIGEAKRLAAPFPEVG